MKIGDKVRFLNSVGGGIIKAFQGKDQVLVEDEDGFDIPAFIRECVVVGDSDMQVHSSNRPKIDPASIQEESPKPTPRPEPKPEETAEGERLNIFLAFLPTDPKAIQTCGYEAYFVNDSNYFLFFNYMSRENNSWTSRFHGEIEPNTKIFLERLQEGQALYPEECCIGRTPPRHRQIL